MTTLFNIENHRSLLNTEIEIAEESAKAYGNYFTVIVDGKLAKARRNDVGEIVGSYTASAEVFEVFANEAAAMEMVRWHEAYGLKEAKVVRIDKILERYISSLRTAMFVLRNAIEL